MKYVTYDYIKSYKRPGSHPLSRTYIFGKTTGEGVKLTPSLLRVKKAKSKKVGKSTKIKFTGCRRLVIEWNKFRDHYYMESVMKKLSKIIKYF